MISLSKPGKAKLGVLSVEHARPITVLNSFRRLWCSSWIRSSGFQQWIKDQIPVEITARRGFDVLTAAAKTLEQFTELGYLLSLNYSKCFDTLAPGPTARLMKSWGLPQGLTDICLDVWSHQVRWVSWQGCVHQEPLCTQVFIPQGDPFGPLVTMLWTACGIRLIQKRSSQQESSHSCVFMDDRNVACSSARKVSQQKTAWNDWSAQVGLVENQTKAAVTTVSSRHRDHVDSEGLSQWLKPTVKLLGCCTLQPHVATRSMKISGLKLLGLLSV